ncbi:MULTISPECIES: hypothetical protein [Microbacterium]|jgi:hypothetical protein|uniref:hypothetical protein n=1 Tax=Microbacterium TaxID=33882 RepID=UPI0006FA57ED|nr:MULTISPECIES: hypothetical protein [unclassified Microbacterium]MBN9197570.1 hypothetical protein [Microbacterium ginsengisoli]MCK9919913.1 hypothetical protein [Microbacteriaceae bacterium K1510]KQR99159.1 hypothetical protein ASG00_00550 [Microbacterium sp. Leaf351]KQS01624.1 hypothetical protein ASF93_10890 [Microbacterium sp. Leaf347]ODU77749.1 MAG: hypothetical protein ABT08_06010 [Microbacterium sp. SCN 71-21]
MSTDPALRTRSGRSRRRRRAFGIGFAAVIAVLGVVALAGAAVSSVQGPRVTAVSVDPQAAVEAGGARVILTTSQSLQKVETSQVTVTPAASFTVQTSGRDIGVRFSNALYDDTQYTVTVHGVVGIGGGPVTTLSESFHTPALSVFMLKRGSGTDTIFRTGLDGAQAVPVFENPHIEDFRATSQHLVMSVRTADDKPELIVTDLDGANARTLPLPGAGDIRDLGVADRGEVIGYTFTDANVSKTSGDASVLYTDSLALQDAAAPPTRIALSGVSPSVAQWRFVPGTDNILVLTFDGRLLLASSAGKDPVDLGSAASIDGIARGSTSAIIERPDGTYSIDLTSGAQTLLTDPPNVAGFAGTVTPLTATTTLRQYAQVTNGATTGTEIYRVLANGTSSVVYTSAATDAVLQVCTSPSARYAAVLIAPNVAQNPYVTTYEYPVPGTVETHIIDLDTGKEVSKLSAFDISWCQVPIE